MTNKHLIIILSILCLGLGSLILIDNRNSISGAPPYGEPETEVPDENPNSIYNWKRPDGPPKIALQVGHWKNDEVPEELEKLSRNTGSSGGGKSEWEVNYRIAELTAEILRDKGVLVEILPTTVEPDYWADAFISIHADGSEDPSTTGYKASGPWRDLTGDANQLVNYIHETYEESTGLIFDPNISKNMRGYYAFAWWKYEHSIHPMTTGVILETGFLTNPNDRNIIIDQPELSAEGLAEGIIKYLSSEGLL